MEETVEDIIRTEAYFIWKTRDKYGIPGTETGDWLEAQRKIQRKLVEDVISHTAKEYLKGGY